MPKKYKLEVIKEKITKINQDTFDGCSLEEMIAELEIHKTQAEDAGYFNIMVYTDYEYGYYDSREDFFLIKGERMETAEEFERRVAASKAQSKAQRERRKREALEKEEKDKKLYEELKKKFG